MRAQNILLKNRALRRLMCLTFMVAFFWVAPLGAEELTGGTYRLFADTFSVVEGGPGATGGSYYLEGSSEQVAIGRNSTSATGSVTFTDEFVNFDERLVLDDGIIDITFAFTNLGGSSNGTCQEFPVVDCNTVMVDLGGGAETAKEDAGRLFAEAVTSTVHSLGMDAVHDGNGVVYLTNLVTAGSAGNIPIIEAIDTVGKFSVSGMSGGTDAGFELRAGFQAMEQGTISVSTNVSTINLGELATGSVSTADVVLTVTTDSQRGYTVTINDDGNLRDGANDIDDVADGAVTAGSEEYGVRTTGGDGQMATDTAISTGTKVVARRSSSATAVQTTLRFSAGIDGSQTKQGSYAHTVTLSGTATP